MCENLFILLRVDLCEQVWCERYKYGSYSVLYERQALILCTNIQMMGGKMTKPQFHLYHSIPLFQPTTTNIVTVAHSK